MRKRKNLSQQNQHKKTTKKEQATTNYKKAQKIKKQLKYNMENDSDKCLVCNKNEKEDITLIFTLCEKCRTTLLKSS